MYKRRACSPEATSFLVRQFVQRSGKGLEKTPEQVMSALIEDVRRKRVSSKDGQLQRFLRDRRITQFEYVSGLDCDGLIEPLGSDYQSGFRMRLKSASNEVRKRFTAAHEACHTFFYELVPEIKFAPHSQDDDEERLCNFGAAALLMPARLLRQDAKAMKPSLCALEELATKYKVSSPTMILRLRSLEIWKCELSHWHRMSDGSFALDRLYGGRRRKWEWDDASLLIRAWGAKESIFGHGFVKDEDDRGTMRYRPVAFELRRHADRVIALWGRGVEQGNIRRGRLFQAKASSSEHDPSNLVGDAPLKFFD